MGSGLLFIIQASLRQNAPFPSQFAGGSRRGLWKRVKVCRLSGSQRSASRSPTRRTAGPAVRPGSRPRAHPAIRHSVWSAASPRVRGHRSAWPFLAWGRWEQSSRERVLPIRADVCSFLPGRPPGGAAGLPGAQAGPSQQRPDCRPRRPLPARPGRQPSRVSGVGAGTRASPSVQTSGRGPLTPPQPRCCRPARWPPGCHRSF